MTILSIFEVPTPSCWDGLELVCESPKYQGFDAPFKGYIVRGINFEKIGAQIKLDFDKRSGPRCPHCENKLPRKKIGRRVVMDCPMSHGSIVYLDFPTVQVERPPQKLDNQ
jgi:hypothetical protein